MVSTDDTTMNSSPPGARPNHGNRLVSTSRCAAARIIVSPRSWRSVSLMSLKPSKSTRGPRRAIVVASEQEHVGDPLGDEHTAGRPVRLSCIASWARRSLDELALGDVVEVDDDRGDVGVVEQVGERGLDPAGIEPSRCWSDVSADHRQSGGVGQLCRERCGIGHAARVHQRHRRAAEDLLGLVSQAGARRPSSRGGSWPRRRSARSCRRVLHGLRTAPLGVFALALECHPIRHVRTDVSSWTRSSVKNGVTVTSRYRKCEFEAGRAEVAHHLRVATASSAASWKRAAISGRNISSNSVPTTVTGCG